MKFGIWDGQAWLRTIFGTVMRWDTLEQAEAVAAAQQADWPEVEWKVHVIGPDGKPYIPDPTP